MQFRLDARANLVAGITSSVATALISIAVVPFFISFLGMEAYGLIGLFLSVQGILAILDVALAPAINREVAQCKSTGDISKVRDLLHTVVILYSSIGVAVFIAITAVIVVFIDDWVTVDSISAETLVQSALLMALVIAIRWPLGIYMGALLGAEKLALVSGVNFLMVGLTNGGAVVVLAIFDSTLQVFFFWQIVAGAMYVLLMRAAAWRVLGRSPAPRFDVKHVIRIWRFAGGTGATAILGLIMLNIDKIVLSGIISLEELGLYALAGMLARTIHLFVLPTYNVIFPRMTVLHAAGDIEGLTLLHRHGARLLCTFIFPVSAVLALFAEPVVTLWTGSTAIGETAAPIVSFLMLGFALNGAMHFAHSLQLASGRSSLTAFMTGALLCVFLPSLLILAPRFGAVGAAAAWALVNIFYLICGTWWTHRHVLRGLGSAWLFSDIGIPLLVTLTVVGGGWAVVAMFELSTILEIGAGTVLGMIAIGVTLACSPETVRFGRRQLPNQVSDGARDGRLLEG